MSFLKRWIDRSTPVNLIMLFFLIMGVSSAFSLQREMFPPMNLDFVIIDVEMRDHSSADIVDESVLQLLLPALDSIEGVKSIKAKANAQGGRIFVEMKSSQDPYQLKQKLERAVNSVQNLPDNALKPDLFILKQKDIAMELVLYGKNASRKELYLLSEEIKNDIKGRGLASIVDWKYSPKREIVIAPDPDILRQKEISWSQLAQQIQSHSGDQVAGILYGEHSRITIKNNSRKLDVDALRKIPIQISKGHWTSLGELCGPNQIYEDFSSGTGFETFDGKDAVILEILRAESEDVIDLCDRVKEHIQTISLPDGYELHVFQDFSLLIKDRLSLIIKNALFGIALIVFILSLFLEWRIALWTSFGISFALISSLFFMELLGASINMLSLFGFLMATGIIVDDAIVIGELFFQKRQQGIPPKEAALATIEEIAWPVIAMVATTFIAFIPMFYVSGVMGKFIAILPLVILISLSLSLFETLFILPVHLAHSSTKSSPFILFRPIAYISNKARPWTEAGLQLIYEKALAPALTFIIRTPYTSSLFVLSLSILIFGIVPTGLLKTSVFPNIDSEIHKLKVDFVAGTPLDLKKETADRLFNSLKQTERLYTKSPVKHITLSLDTEAPDTAVIVLELISQKEGRTVKAKEFLKNWQNNMPALPALLTLNFESTKIGPPGKNIEINFKSSSEESLLAAEAQALSYLCSLKGLIEVNSTKKLSPLQAKISLRKEFHHSQWSEKKLIDEVQAHFRGIRIDTFNRGDQQFDIILKAPEAKRTKLSQLNSLRLSDGMQLEQVAHIRLERETLEIQRVDGLRSIGINANLSDPNTEGEKLKQIERNLLAPLLVQYPDLTWSYDGEAQEGGEAINSLLKAFMPALFCIYFILATLFNSYLQPILIMTAIPFACMGALLGHLILGFSFSLLSGFGVIALAGIAVNDSLVLTEAINQLRKKGVPCQEAIFLGVKHRLRPIILTSLTTMAGMGPILFETSFQAQILIPMVTSIVFGVAFSTILILLLIPLFYLVLEKLKESFHA